MTPEIQVLTGLYYAQTFGGVKHDNGVPTIPS